MLHSIHGLDVFKKSNKNRGKVHTSSDGQKFEVSKESLNADRSFKYFGQNAGITAYTFADDKGLLFYSTAISASIREMTYVIDGLVHNSVVKSDIHSTDTHGYSEAIFATCSLLGVSFAPRIKGVNKQVLYAFNKLENADNYKIKPTKYINTELIEENWDDILRFIATIKSHHSSASQIFKRLNSYSTQNPLYKALKEYGRIHKSIFILQYIDSVELRQAIEKQLNIVEHSHRFTKAITFGNDHQFLETTLEEQKVAEACCRLIKNSIIYFNYRYIDNQYQLAENSLAETKILEALQHGSIIVWQHINFHGEYDFNVKRFKNVMG